LVCPLGHDEMRLQRPAVYPKPIKHFRQLAL